MRDGQTRKLGNKGGASGIDEFRERYTARLVLLSGPAAGTGFACDRKQVVIGRGPGVDWEINDGSLSRQHATIEYVAGRFRVQDLGSTNGIIVGGSRVQVADLVHGETFEIGEQRVQLVIEAREEIQEVFEISLET